MKPSPRKALAAAVALVVAASAGLGGCAIREPVDLPAPADFEVQLLDRINALRLNEGAGRLSTSDCMTTHARDRATALPGAETVPREDLPADCGDFDYVGENLSRSDQGASEVVNTWAEDELQLPNLIDPQFERAGVGCVGVSFEDTNRTVEPGEELAGMACSVIFQGYAE